MPVPTTLTLNGYYGGANPPKWVDAGAPNERLRPSFRAVPKVTMGQAVHLPQNFNRLLKTAPETPVDSGSDIGPRCFVVPIEDDSMVSRSGGSDSFHPGDEIVVDPDRTPSAGDFVLVHFAGEAKATLRKYRPRILGYELAPLNTEDYAVEQITANGPAARIIGLMIRHIRIYGRH